MHIIGTLSLRRSRFLLPLLLAACSRTVGPDYHLPAQSVAANPAASQPFVGAKAAGISEQPLPDQWWQLYQNPRLDALVTQALAANADLRAADANLRRAAALRREVEAGRTVSTGLGATAGFSRLAELGPGYTFSDLLSYDATVSVSLPLDLSGRIRRGIEAAQADEESARAARDLVRVAVAAAVTRAYAAVCAANYSHAARVRVLDLQRSTLQATERLQQGGRGTAFDVSRARVATDQSVASLPGFTARRQANLFLIATLLGKPPADYPTDIADCSTLPELTRPLPVGDGAALLRRRPDIRAAERKLAADTARIGVATADLYPDISIGGVFNPASPVKLLGTNNSFGFTVGPLLSWTFPNRPVVKAQIAAAGAQADADLAHFDATVLTALRETETALDAYSQGRAELAALTRARDNAATAAAQADRLFRFGRTDFLQLLDAQRSLANAEATLASAQTTLLNDQIDIFLALGGGWQ